ncbi:MAG: GNAT family N-acetyltransferase [Actinomycetota bacterium]|nr:GNAT family N-acetyltransferase [Actinomycetota bacterium]
MRTFVQLREVTVPDLGTLYEQQAETEANDMAAFPARDEDAFAAHWRTIMADPANILRTIIVGDEIAGNIVSWDNEGKREVGYWIGKAYWGRGIATAALAQILDTVKTRPLYAHVANHNAGSIRVLEKCGFAFAGTDVGAPYRSNQPVHELVFELR